MSKRKVLIVGGAGAFGFRLAEGLCATTDLAVLIAGRDLTRAQTAAATLNALHPGCDVAAVRLNAATVSAETIRSLDAWAVVDAAGPFQAAAPRVARAAIAAGCHYVDIADARDFVAAFPTLDAQARSACSFVAACPASAGAGYSSSTRPIST
jgi:saccharopine dehydrogenase-like NADP-dependent oxidoreductase